VYSGGDGARYAVAGRAPLEDFCLIQCTMPANPRPSHPAPAAPRAGHAGVAQYACEAPRPAGDAIMTDSDALRGAPGQQG